MYQKDKQTIQQEKEEQQKIDNINAEITAKNNEKTKIIKDSSINQKSIQDRIDIIQQEYEVIKNKVNHLEQSSEDTSVFDNLIKELDAIQIKQEELDSQEIIAIIDKNKQRLAELKAKAEPVLKN